MPAINAAPKATAFNTAAPRLEVAQLNEIVLRHYGLGVQCSIMASERDLTARADASDGRSFVLKVANATEDPTAIALQNAALQYIENHGPGIPVPRVTPDVAGNTSFELDIDGVKHVTRMLTYLSGQQLSRVAPTREICRNLGTLAAQLADALRDFRHVGAEHEILWDMKHVTKLASWVPEIEDSRVRRQVERTFERFISEVKPQERSLCWQIVHNDLNPHNVLVDANDPSLITGILDFGDMVRSPLIYDIAVSCAYQFEGAKSGLDPATSFLGAFHRIRPVLEEELDLLPIAMATRDAMTITITNWRAKRYPENREYILRNQPRAAAALDYYSSLSHSQFVSILTEACHAA